MSYLKAGFSADAAEWLDRAFIVCLGAALPIGCINKAAMYVFLVLCSVIAVIRLIKTRSSGHKGTQDDYWLMLILTAIIGWLLFVSSVGISPAYSLGKTLDFAFVCALGVLLSSHLRNLPDHYVRSLLKVTSLVCLLVIAVTTTDVLAGDPTISSLFHDERKAVSYYRWNFVSSALAVISPLVWAYAIETSKKKSGVKLFIYLSAFGVIFSIFLCGGRAGWVAGIVGLVSFGTLGLLYQYPIRVKHLAASVIAVALGLLLFTVGHDYQALINRLELTSAEQSRGLGGGRIEIWSYAIEHMLDQPLTGIGVNAFRYLPDRVDAHPHNISIQIILETGLVGAFLFVLLLSFLIFSAAPHLRNSIMSIGTLSSLLAFLTASQFNKSLFDI